MKLPERLLRAFGCAQVVAGNGPPCRFATAGLTARLRSRHSAFLLYAARRRQEKEKEIFR